MLLLRSERGIQGPSVLPHKSLPPLSTCSGFGSGFAGSDALSSQEMKTTPVDMAPVSFSSSSRTIPQCLASNHHLFTSACSSSRPPAVQLAVTRPGLIFHRGVFPVTAVDNVLVCPVQTSLFCPMGVTSTLQSDWVLWGAQFHLYLCIYRCRCELKMCLMKRFHGCDFHVLVKLWLLICRQ